jgi:catechol 2,3-dioxygenase-like lactoylglutathione lyase family enzyme
MPNGSSEVIENAKFMCSAHSVSVQTADFDKAYRFYTEILGLDVDREPFQFKTRMLAWLRAGTILIELYSVRSHSEPGPYNPNGVGPDHLAFEVCDLDAFVDHLKLNEVVIKTGPWRPPSGDPYQPRVLFVEGPDGEELQFREPRLET